MPEHLVIPQFLRDDVLAAQTAESGFQKISDLANKSTVIVDPTTGRPVSDSLTEESLVQTLAGLKAMGMTDETIEGVQKALIEKTVTDPVVLLQPYAQPSDFTAEYPQPLDPTEILTLCEEISTYQALPEVVTDTNADQWREMTSLDFTGAGVANDGFFLKGGCPDPHARGGENQSITRMYIGDQATLTYEDIKHSLAVAQIRGLGISAISTQNRRAAVSDAKAKEMLTMEINVINNWDRALVKGNSATNPLAFDGIETQVTSANGARVNADPTGQYDIEEFDNFLAAGCARATHIFGHPKASRGIKYTYMSLGATGGTQPIMQVVMNKEGQMVPGFTLADSIDTAIGRIVLVPDFRFTTIQVQPDRFHSTVYPLRLYHNGEPLVYKSTQTPLSFKDLAPGCTAISFEIYAVTALVIKHMCAQAAFTANWPGVVGTGCDIVGE
jgi:hypothetical protein